MRKNLGFYAFWLLPVGAVIACALEEAPVPPGTASAAGSQGTTLGAGTDGGVTSAGTPTGTAGGTVAGGVTTTTDAGTVTTGAAVNTDGSAVTSTTGLTSTTTTDGTTGLTTGTTGLTVTSTSAGAGGATSTAVSTETATSTTGEAIDLLTIVGALDGRLVMMPCGENSTTDDCAGGGWIADGQSHACQNGSLDAQIVHPIGGTDGQTYNVTMHFYGINEPKNYGNAGTREAAPGRPQNNDDGASPTPWHEVPANHTYPQSNYNTYEIRVRDQNGQETAAYYLNSDTQEGHWTYVINYSKTIPVIGGGSVLLRIFDLNCRQIKNCGVGSGDVNQCTNLARTLTFTGADPQPPMGVPPNGLSQPGLGRAANQAGQWLFIDVTAVTEG